jgi:signal transduction histidine kinase
MYGIFHFRPNLRLRVAIAFSVACICVVGALGIALYAASEELEDALVEDLVTSEMNYLVQRYRDNPNLPPLTGSLIQTYIVRSAADRANLPDYLKRLDAGEHELSRGYTEYHVAVLDVDSTRLYVTYDLIFHEQRIRDFQLLLVLALASIAVISLAFGYWLAGVLVNQVTDLAHRVNRLGTGGPDEPMAQPGQDAEVALLAHAFDEYRARIHAMLRREQEFTANASHELRTPLTAIRTSTELLAADASLDERARARVAAIAGAAERMTEQIKALLFLAREQELGAVERVPLAGFVADAAAMLHAEIARKGLHFETAIPPGATLEANPRALNIVLTNLVRNAVQYTEHGFIRVSFEARRLTVADSGTGIDAEHLPHLFERFYRGVQTGSGLGIGLAIVKRICEHYGWRIDVESRRGDGSAFTVVFP